MGLPVGLRRSSTRKVRGNYGDRLSQRSPRLGQNRTKQGSQCRQQWAMQLNFLSKKNVYSLIRSFFQLFLTCAPSSLAFKLS